MEQDYDNFQKKLLKAFPKKLSKEVEQVVEFLKINNSINDISSFTYEVNFKGEILTIPSRIYFDGNVDSSDESLTGVQKSILSCIGLRHFDGRVRERYLKKINVNSNGFEVPYVFQLLGEYVIEIIEVVDTIIVKDKVNDYLDFIIENPTYFMKTESRIRSYWSCYYRQQYWDIKNYPAYKIVNRLKQDLKTC
jgi:hypothetical protein